MKRILIISLLISLYLSCSKGDLSGSNTINALAYATNAYEGDGLPQPLGGINIYINPASSTTVTLFDTTQYLYSTVTGSNGQFSFTNLNPNALYQLFAVAWLTDSSGQQLLFSGSQVVNTGSSPSNSGSVQLASQTLNLTLDTRYQQVFFVTAQNLSQEPLPGCPICIFNNQQLAMGMDCQKSEYQLTTDGYGRALKVNMKTTIPYYINAIFAMDTATTANPTPTVIETLDILVALHPAGLTEMTLTLHP